MFNRNKLIKLSNELSEKGYATNPEYVAGCFWFDVPIGSRKNFLW